MSNINTLNDTLRKVDTHADLMAEYRKLDPDALSINVTGIPDPTNHVSLNVCSDAADFVVTFLSGNKGLYEQVMNNAGMRKILDSSSAAALLPKVKAGTGMRFGLLENHASNMAHQCVFVGAGNQWAFYQANVNGGPNERFTLVPKLNPLGRNWCLNDLSEKGFDAFFIGLTDARYGIRLFKGMTAWQLRLFSSSGQNLLA